jgi:hypothetical protein
MSITFAMGFLLLLFKSLWVFFGGLFLITIGQSVLRTSLSSSVTAEGNNHGEKLGIMSSIMLLTMSIVPILAGSLFSIHIGLPFLAANIIMLIAYGILNKHLPQKESVSSGQN